MDALAILDTHSANPHCSRTPLLYSHSLDDQARHAAGQQIDRDVRYAMDRNPHGKRYTTSFYQWRSNMAAALGCHLLRLVVPTVLLMTALLEISLVSMGTGMECSRLEDVCTLPSRGDLCIGGGAY